MRGESERARGRVRERGGRQGVRASEEEGKRARGESERAKGRES